MTDTMTCRATMRLTRGLSTLLSATAARGYGCTNPDYKIIGAKAKSRLKKKLCIHCSNSVLLLYDKNNLFYCCQIKKNSIFATR
jgi:hypothetical protein